MSVTSTIGTRGKDDACRTSHFPWGTGIGASHQTGWTGLVAKLLQQSGE